MSVYFSSIALLLLGAVSLQRTTTELRAANLSRDQQQAFWLAEAGLDYAARRLQLPGGLQDGSYTAPERSLGRATVTVSTVSSEITSSASQRVTRRLTATGTTGTGRTTQVTATVVEDAPLRGVWAKESIAISMGFEPIRFTMPVRTRSGQASAIRMLGQVRHDGELQIGPASGDAPWVRPIGLLDTDGVFLDPYFAGLGEEAADNVPTTTAHSPSIATVGSFAPVAVPYADEKCGAHLAAPPFTTLIVPDGDPLDLTGPDDGVIEMCVQSVTSYYRGGIAFQAPATVYVVGTSDQRGMEHWAVNSGSIFTTDPGHVVPEAAPNHAKGVRLMVRKAPHRASVVRIAATEFGGSIYAPDSNIELILMGRPRENVHVEHIVGKQIDIAAFGLSRTTVTSEDSASVREESSPEDDTTNLLSWTDGP